MIPRLDQARAPLKLLTFFVVFFVLAGGPGESRAQGTIPPSRVEETATPAAQPGASKTIFRAEHNFWDKENKLLFTGVAASRTLDYFSTLNMRRRGVQEIFLTNEAVDDHAGFAAIEAAGTGISIGASYFFHRYGHHKLERWTSIVHISLSTSGTVRNYCLKSVRAAR